MADKAQCYNERYWTVIEWTFVVALSRPNTYTSGSVRAHGTIHSCKCVIHILLLDPTSCIEYSWASVVRDDSAKRDKLFSVFLKVALCLKSSDMLLLDYWNVFWKFVRWWFLCNCHTCQLLPGVFWLWWPPNGTMWLADWLTYFVTLNGSSSCVNWTDYLFIQGLLICS